VTSFSLSLHLPLFFFLYALFGLTVSKFFVGAALFNLFTFGFTDFDVDGLTTFSKSLSLFPSNAASSGTSSPASSVGFSIKKTCS